MAAADPYQNTRDLVRIEGNKLIVGNDRVKRADAPEIASLGLSDAATSDEPLVFDLAKVGNIYVVGGGKAAQRMAKAIEDALGDRITEGHINAKKGDEVYLERIEVTLAGHPIPDEDSVAGARRILEIEQKARAGDIVFLSESGGGSALMALPAPGITLHDLQEVYRILYFGCGAPMPVANAVRNLLTVVRLRHARHVRDATLIHVSTPEEPPKVRPHLNHRPHDADPYEHAIGILKHYGCWETAPESVRAFLLRADPQYGPLRPEEWRGKNKHYFRVMGPEVMLDAALQRAAAMGLPATVLASSLNDIEAQAAGEMLAHIAQEVEVLDRPLPAPCALICGGEVVVATGNEPGIGGRNEEFVLSLVARIAGSRRIVVASADSDGSDGPTDAAGGIVDGYTAARAAAMGVDIGEALRRHDSHTALTALGDTIDTGIQKTNVRDLRVIYVAGTGR
jgi:glycerate-2-kinase